MFSWAAHTDGSEPSRIGPCWDTAQKAAPPAAMQDGTSVGRTPHTISDASPTEKTAVRSQAEYRVRCPDCNFSKRYDYRGDAISHQRRLPCPHCDRMLGVSEVPPRSIEDHIKASEAVAAAQEAHHELQLDGPVPSVEAILEAMGRDTEGYPLPDGPSDLSAGEAARKLLSDEVR